MRDKVVCHIPVPVTRDTEAIGLVRISASIGGMALSGGGLLLHAALAEYRGSGFVLAGIGGIGKSTASSRLPPPWHSLCDDMTLVVRDKGGNYWAHPWPTWSRFFSHAGGRDDSWPVEDAVPLRALFFLDRSQSNHVIPVNMTQATSMLLESAIDLNRVVSRLPRQDPSMKAQYRELLLAGIEAARALATAVPAYRLELSLDGEFWKEIEQVLPVGNHPSHCPPPASRATGFIADEPGYRNAMLVAYAGPSMNPTLRGSDLLEVRPCITGRVKPGDVLYFHAPGETDVIVRRVTAVDRLGAGICTRGDNCAQADEWVLSPGDIIGRVVAAQRGDRRRAIPGGWRGLMAARWLRLARRIWKYAGPVPRLAYGFVAGIRLPDRLLPYNLRPRVVRFDPPGQVLLKLKMGNRTVGYYSEPDRKWYIRRLCRLFVTERALPVSGRRPAVGL